MIFRLCLIEQWKEEQGKTHSKSAMGQILTRAAALALRHKGYWLNSGS